VALALSTASVLAQTPSLEYAVKATYLYKFIPFVDWPPGSFSAPDAPVNLCIIGHDPFGDLLDRAIAGVTVGGHPIALRRLPVARRDEGCHVMFLGGSDAQSIPEALAAVRGAPVLTITDSADSGDASGIVNFVLADNRVRFQIDERAAAENRLGMNAKLLSLATSVRRR
jgi:hypothetical protein